MKHVRWRRILPVLVSIPLAMGVAVATIAWGSSPASQDDVIRASRADLNIVVTGGGSIRAHKSVQYPVEVERRWRGGDLTILSLIPAGTYVTRQDVANGLILAELDSSDLQQQLLQEEIELTGDRESLSAARETYNIQLIENESELSESQLRVRFALMDFQRFIGAELAEQMIRDANEAPSLSDHIAPFIEMIRDDPNLLAGSGGGQRLKRYRDEIVLAEGNLSTARARLAGTRVLHDANYVSDLDVQGDTLNVTSREFSYQNAQVSLDLFLRYDFPRDCEELLSEYVEANRQLGRAYARCRSRLARARARLGYRERRYASQLERVEEVKQQIANCTIRAKAPGLVVYGSGDSSDAYRRMRRRAGGGGIIAEGESVYTGQVLISMPDTASMVAEVSIHENQIDQVRPGQPARITMDAFPDRVFHGQVLEVAPVPDRNRNYLNPDLRVYTALVQIDGTHDSLKTRMSCQVDILAEELNDVLAVPIQLVARRGGQKVVYVKTDAGHAAREVTTGSFNDTLVQIVAGLREGEQLLAEPPVVIDDMSLTFQPRSEFALADPNLPSLAARPEPRQVTPHTSAQPSVAKL